ncbi:MAG TPA: hypothetical protein VGA66_02735, partial [Mycobacterium sp.]
MSGTVAATQSGTWDVRLQDGAGTDITSATRGSEQAVSVQIVDGSGAQITSFGGSGGTASNFGSAVPSEGTSIGLSDGTNSQNPRVFDADSGGGTEYVAGASLRIEASGGSIPITAAAGAVAAGTPRVTLGSDDPAVTALQIVDDWDESDRAKVNPIAGQAGVAAGSGTVSALTQRVTIATDDAVSTALVGVAHDAAATSVNPALVGLYSSAAAPTGVSTDGDAVRAWGLANGSQVVQLANAGVLAVSGSGTATGALRVELPTNGTGVVGLNAGSNEIGSLAANQSVNVSQINGVTPLMGAGNTGTGSPRVTVATDQAAIVTHGHGATGATAPTGATLAGAKSGANMAAVTQGDATVTIDTSTATTVERVALASGQRIRVTSWSVIAGGTGTIKLVRGTGTDCDTG